VTEKKIPQKQKQKENDNIEYIAGDLLFFLILAAALRYFLLCFRHKHLFIIKILI
jgi:hypothetical protein